MFEQDAVCEQLMMEVELAAAGKPGQEKKPGKLDELEGGYTDSTASASPTRNNLGVDLDTAINPWSLINVALPLAYFCVGFAITFIDTPVKIYAVKHLDVGAERLQVLKTVKMLPWSFKILNGLLTDCVPVFGMRRKPYFVIGWCIYVAAGLSLALLHRPNIHHLVGLLFTAAAGYVMADVAADSLVVERSRLEPMEQRAHFQSMVFICRHAGAFTGHILGTLLYNKQHWGWGLAINQIFWLYAAMPSIILPFVYFLRDPQRFDSVIPIRTQFEKLWLLVRRRTVWKPMSFVAWYNICHIPNAAWEPFLIKGLHFQAYQMGILSSAGAAFTFAGVAVYRAFFMGCNWRNVYILTSLAGTGFSVLQLLLIFRINVRWHMPDLLFSAGDEVLGDFIMAMHFLPLVNMMLMLCPEGAEGTSFAMVTTLNNVAKTAASNIGTLLVKIWDVSNKALKHHNYSGLWRLTLLTSMIQIAGLFPVSLLPKGKEEMAKKQEVLDFWGGVGLTSFLIGAWCWTISQAIIIMRKDA